jgi:hypothetical protein
LKLDRVHLLTWPETREFRLLDVLFGTDLHEGAVAAHAHADGTAADGIGA